MRRQMIKNLWIFLTFQLVLVYLLYNAYTKTVLHRANYMKKSSLANKDDQASGVRNDQKITFHDRNLQNFSNLAADEDSGSNATELTFNKIFWSHLAESYVPKVSIVITYLHYYYLKVQLEHPDLLPHGLLDSFPKRLAEFLGIPRGYSMLQGTARLPSPCVSFEESMSIVKNVRGQAVKTVQRGSVRMCGDELNAIVRLQDSTVICARYTKNDFYVYAEVLAFYLSRMLQMDNVPEVVLASTNKTSGYWNEVDFNIVSWKENQIISMMRRIVDVTPIIYEPEIMKEAYRNGQIITSTVIRSSKIKNPRYIADIIQWGNMLVFDNLIGHFDRLFFWQKGKKKSKSGVLHNAVKSSDGKLWLVDHEQAFFYQKAGRDIAYNFIQLLRFHEKRLKTMCVFQYSLVYELQKLSKQPSPFETFWNFTRSHEPLLDTMKKDYRFKLIGNLFDRRLSQILEWIKECKEIHSGVV